MAGISTPKLAATVSNSGGLGSLGLGTSNVTDAREMINDIRALTERPFNANFFAYKSRQRDPAREAAWLAALTPLFNSFNAEPPPALQTIFTSFVHNDDMLKLVLEIAPPVVSFHFGLPSVDKVRALKAAGCTLVATATNLAEADAIRDAGIDAVVAQGWEAGGHRGVFDPDAPDDRLGTLALTRLLVVRSGLPVIAAGGIADGYGIKAALALGAVAAQLGTAFIGCPESGADQDYREVLTGQEANHTVMTDAISGRPARCIQNHLTRWADNAGHSPPGYPVTYDAARALAVAARAAGDGSFAARWAGQGAALARSLPAADLMNALVSEQRSTIA